MLRYCLQMGYLGEKAVCSPPLSPPFNVGVFGSSLILVHVARQQHPRLQILRTDGEGMIDDVIIHGT